MTYFHLMNDEIPAKQIETHPPYVTSEEAIKAAMEEAQSSQRPVQIYRVISDRVDSQPWRVILPPASAED
jgi:hypothetical protein